MSESDQPVRFIEFLANHSAIDSVYGTASRLPALLKRATLVSHPGVMPIVASCLESDSSMSIATEYCHDNSLDRLPHLVLPLDSLLRDLAGSIAAMHRIGLAHGRLARSTIYVHPTRKDSFVLDLMDGFLASPMPDRDGPVALANDVRSLGATIQEIMACYPGDRDELAIDLVRFQDLLKEMMLDNWSDRPDMEQVVSGFQEAMTGTGMNTRLPLFSSSISDHTLEVQSGSLDQLAKDLLVPEDFRSIGRYAIQRSLGEGGMGSVFLATDTSSGDSVAIKILAKRVANDEKATRRFAKEARLLSQVTHPAIARLVEFNTWEGTMYLAMEYVAGGCLADVTRTGRMVPESVVIAAIADVARGLACAHQNGMVHRDIKPANLLLTETGERAFANSKVDSDKKDSLLKIADFGLAKHFDASESIAMTQTGLIMGTPHYMAPEQCQGGDVGPATDVYAIGVTLFQCLTGKLPFEGQSAVEIFRMHCDSPVPDIRKYCGVVSDAMQSVVEKCMAKNPHARYRDASELLQALEELLSGKSSSIAVHPAIPDLNANLGKGQMKYQFQWKLKSSPDELWPYVSNTDRVNHAIGLPAVRYRTFQDPKLGVRRMATVRAMGMTMEWEEHPYEWIEGRRLSVLRQFPSGPFYWFTNVVELMPQEDGGTLVIQTLQMLPRNFMGRVFAKLQIGNKSERNFGKVYEAIDDYLRSNAHSDVKANAFSKSKHIDREQKRNLIRRFERLRINATDIDPRVIDTLEQYLAHASDLEVARIRPLAFAERFGLDARELVQTCLLAAREGALILMWDILCPTCRIPSDVKESLKGLQDHGHCEACSVDFELDFAQSIELVFRAHPDIRTAETRTYCIGGPAFSRHVAAQVRLQPDERLQLELALGEGQYRLRGGQLPYVIEFRVSSGSRVGRWDLDLSRPPSKDQIPTLRVGEQVLSVFNPEALPRQFRIERVASRADALTAADAAQIPAFRDWFPDEVLSPGQMVGLTNVTLFGCQLLDASRLYQELSGQSACSLIVKHLQAIASVVTANQGCVIKSMQDGLSAVFPTAANAVLAATAMEQQSGQWGISLRQTIHQGVAVVATINDRLDYFGETPQMLEDLLRASHDHELIITEACLIDPSVMDLLNPIWQMEMIPPIVAWPEEKLMSCRLGKIERTSKNF